MAKQTFTTGQVLTAAQMTSLQQTAMGGGSATAKTASYVLVAADAGSTVAMNAAGATTITINTGLFAAGDTVFIQNLGVGACTLTAGSATVATAGSLILPQNDAGILYFTAAGASIFYDFIQAGAVSPLTTKGDVYTFSTSDARLAVGSNATVLTADSAEATGLKWATPASGGKVLQVVTANYGTIVTNSTTTFAATGLTCNITPTLNTSKVLVMVVHADSFRTATASGLILGLFRGATEIWNNGAAGDEADFSTADTVIFSTEFTYLDSPATTSATTYLTKLKNYTAQASVRTNANSSAGTSQIILMEIGA